MIEEKHSAGLGNYKEGIVLSLWTLGLNFLLGSVKLAAGLWGRSSAMVADAAHSYSDCASTVAVIAGLKMASKSADADHPYGHEKYELIFANILSILLGLTAVKIGYDALMVIAHGSYQVPGLAPLLAAVFSLAVKEVMYRLTLRKAKKIGSVAMEADAWHHRTDALSSVGAFVGILGARLGLPVLDPVTGLLVSLLVLKVAIDLYRKSVSGLVDSSTDAETVARIQQLLADIDGIEEVNSLKTRVFGASAYADVTIKVDGALTVEEGHDIATLAHNKIEANLPKIKHIMVHIEPMDQDHLHQ
ncbi:cation diffusion facilitator family transporter [Peptococcus niger]|uniref:Cation diffusion facilitator family transporter n=1 Tax=Peptococcus niger TaxID=2741 RepID=A0A1G6UBF0_PEPNI|nr:cation diffusion facilitator family transporter [Peptococcus niger]SDD38591.1 cation diffusion facilitator family transporter [Peptococcus niger]